MRIWVISDLHVDVAPYKLAATPDATDVIVIAGDVRSKLTKQVLPWLAEHVLPRGLPLVYVPGNHDFYGTNISDEADKALARAAELGVHLLVEGETVIIGDVRFVGGTLWTDYRVYGDPQISRNEASTWMNDHRKIRYGNDYRKFSPKEAGIIHHVCRERLVGVLGDDSEATTVVVTHHGPHPTSLRYGEPTEPLDGSYASDLSDLMGRYRPALWIHGHIHVNRDYRIGETRIVSNPRGYIFREGRGQKERVTVENPDHDPGFVVEL